MKPCKKAWSAFYEQSFAAGGPLNGVFRPYEKENVRMFRNNIFKGIESDAENYELEIERGASPEDLSGLLSRAFKLNNEKNTACSRREMQQQRTARRRHSMPSCMPSSRRLCGDCDDQFPP